MSETEKVTKKAAKKAPNVDKSYKLRRNIAPLSYILPSKHSNRHPLLHFDEEENTNRSLRYSSNQKTPFQDDQDKNVVLEPIIFEDGFLRVPKNNPVLQWFLDVHPEKNKVFEEVNNEVDAQDVLDVMDMEFDAMIAAKALDMEDLERIGRVILRKDVTKMSTAELKRDIRVYASRNPSEFLDMLDDPITDLTSKVALMFDKGLLGFREGKNVHFNLPDNKKRMVSVPNGEDRNSSVAKYFQTDNGVDTLMMLERLLKD